MNSILSLLSNFNSILVFCIFWAIASLSAIVVNVFKFRVAKKELKIARTNKETAVQKSQCAIEKRKLINEDNQLQREHEIAILNYKVLLLKEKTKKDRNKIEEMQRNRPSRLSRRNPIRKI